MCMCMEMTSEFTTHTRERPHKKGTKRQNVLNKKAAKQSALSEKEKKTLYKPFTYEQMIVTQRTRDL